MASRAARRCRGPRQARSADRASRERQQRGLRHGVRRDGALRVWIDCSAMPVWRRQCGCRGHVSLLARRPEASLTSPRQFADAIERHRALLSPPPGRAATDYPLAASVSSRARRLSRSSAQAKPLEVLWHTWDRSVGVGPCQLELDVAVELLKHSSQLSSGPGGPIRRASSRSASVDRYGCRLIVATVSERRPRVGSYDSAAVRRGACASGSVVAQRHRHEEFPCVAQ